ncbi:MAG: hypothetical protein JF565_11490 [Propionibacteriales bacterium]|nr:hypothetical protein [Propionibacteriales bacterium]
MGIRVGPGVWRRTHEPADGAQILPPYLSATEVLHPRAAAPTVLMVILNLPAIAPPDADDIYRGLAPLSAALAVLGIAATVGLLRRVDWGTPMILAVAVLNVLVGEVAVARGLDHGLVGIALGLLTLALATPAPRHEPRL